MINKPKTEQAAPLLRIPKAKNKLGLKIPKIAMPHDDLIVADKPKFEIVPNQNEKTSLPSHTTQTTHSSRSSLSSMTRQTIKDGGDIAPTKNYQKVANSITKQAIPNGFFKGKDKHLYDVLYALTRGAIEPKRTVRISKNKLMKMSGIGSRITFDSCIERLQIIGLLKLVIYAGEHAGNEFEILLPEETTSVTSVTSHTSSAQKPDRLLTLETSQTSQSLNPANTEVYKVPKTSLKTNTKNDDDARVTAAFSVLTNRLDTAIEKLTGKGVSSNDSEKWGTLADLLILEMEAAARRTDSISSVPAFLTEVLRRKLLSSASPSSAKPPKVKLDTVGKPNAAGEYEKKPLDAAGREAALLELRDFAGEDFLADFEKWYTAEDWQWLAVRLNRSEEPETPINVD